MADRRENSENYQFMRDRDCVEKDIADINAKEDVALIPAYFNGDRTDQRSVSLIGWTGGIAFGASIWIAIFAMFAI